MIVGSIGNILDGNIYLVSQGENIRQTQQTDFGLRTRIIVLSVLSAPMMSKPAAYSGE